MANSAKAAKARRDLEASGGIKLRSVTIPDRAAWVSILSEGENPILQIPEGWDEETPEKIALAIAWATGEYIRKKCQEWHREQYEKIIAADTGLLERTSPAQGGPPPEPPRNIYGPHKSVKDWQLGQQSKGAASKGRSLSPDEAWDYMDEITWWGDDGEFD